MSRCRFAIIRGFPGKTKSELIPNQEKFGFCLHGERRHSEYKYYALIRRQFHAGS